MKVVTFASVKGGVGKTAAAVFTAQALAARGARVIVIDGDPNNCATDFLARDVGQEEIVKRDLYLALTGKRPLEGCLLGNGSIRLIPATPALAKAGIELINDPGVVLRFPKEVRGLEADIVIFDTPPSLTLELTVALYTADVVLVPVGISRWSVSAFRVVSDAVAGVCSAIDKGPRLLALPAIVTPKEAEALWDISTWSAVRSPIFRSAAIRNALNAGTALREGSLALRWYEALAQEVMV